MRTNLAISKHGFMCASGFSLLDIGDNFAGCEFVGRWLRNERFQHQRALSNSELSACRVIALVLGKLKNRKERLRK
jgi:hypothetical protein